VQRTADQRKKRLRFSIGAALVGALVAAFTLFAGALPAAAITGSANYSISETSVNVVSGHSGSFHFTPSNVSAGSSSVVCFDADPGVPSGGLNLSDVSFSPSVTLLTGTTATQTITFSVKPTAGAGSVSVGIAGCDGDTVTADGNASVTINATTPPAGTPILDHISPTFGPNGTQVTFTLQSAAQVTSVAFGGTSVSVGGGTVLSFVVDAPDGNGTVDVSVANGSGTTTLADAFTYMPAVTSLAPTSGPIGQTVTIGGSNFTGATGVTFGGTPTSFSVTNDSTISAAVPAGHAVGAVVDVRVTTSSGMTPNTSADDFTYAPTAGPTITGVSGTCTVAGGTTIDVTGTAFVVGATATIGGDPANISVNSATSATVICPAQGSTGSYSLVIAVTSQPTNPFPVTYAAAAAPTVTGLDPNMGPIAGGNSVTVTGTNFQSSGLEVKFGDNTASCSNVTSTSMTCVAPAHDAGAVDVVVSVNDVASATSDASKYTYTEAPVITSIDPTSGVTGTSVTVNGFGFTGATAVRFGTTTVDTADVTINSDTKITVLVPTSLTPDDYDIRVVTPHGTSAASDADVFTVTAGQVASLTLRGRFTLVGWVGKDNIPVGDALKGGPDGPQNGTNDVTDKVSVIWGFNTITQTFQAYFPSAANVPGANDLTSLEYGVGYFVGLDDPSAGVVVWKVEIGSPS
jgi:hypothetical protein